MSQWREKGLSWPTYAPLSLPSGFLNLADCSLNDYSVRKGRLFLLQKTAIVPPLLVTYGDIDFKSFWSTVWSSVRPSNHQSFYWKVLRNKVLNNFTIAQWFPENDPNCSLCHFENETTIHWLFECHELSKPFWIRFHEFIQRYFLPQLPDMVTTFDMVTCYYLRVIPRSSQAILHLCHSYALWTLWRARLRHHFDNTNFTLQQLWDVFLQSLGLHFQALYSKNSKEGPMAVTLFMNRWRLHQVSTLSSQGLHFFWI